MHEKGACENLMADYEAREQAQKAILSLEAHERECKAMRRADQQWRDSCDRAMRDNKESLVAECIEIKAMLATHSSSDASFQGTIDRKLGGWNKFILTTLSALLLASLGVIADLVLELSKVHHQ